MHRSEINNAAGFFVTGLNTSIMGLFVYIAVRAMVYGGTITLNFNSIGEGWAEVGMLSAFTAGLAWLSASFYFKVQPAR